jgi:hypothetical protein
MRFFFIGPRILGIRPGISFGASELLRLATKPKQNKPSEPVTGSFVYVIRGDHNMVKVGVTTNPQARLASLRTGSAFPIDFSYIAVTPGTGYDIEAGAHAMLAQVCHGAWANNPVSAHAVSACSVCGSGGVIGGGRAGGAPSRMDSASSLTPSRMDSASSLISSSLGCLRNHAAKPLRSASSYSCWIRVGVPVGVDQWGWSLRILSHLCWRSSPVSSYDKHRTSFAQPSSEQQCAPGRLAYSAQP